MICEKSWLHEPMMWERSWCHDVENAGCHEPEMLKKGWCHEPMMWKKPGVMSLWCGEKPGVMNY